MATTPAADDFDVDAIEAAYDRLIRYAGTPGPAAKRLDLQPPIADDGETDCWTHAWELAQRTGARYVEGLCTRGNGGMSRHAWVEEDTPFGRRIVETTPGYEQARAYRGITIDCSPTGDVAKATGPDRPRSSVIQVALGAGFAPSTVFAMVAL